MANGASYNKLIRSIFERLHDKGLRYFPDPGTLAKKLRESIKKSGAQFHLKAGDAALFGSAAVEMWLKAVHSFLISTSVMKSSPIWSAVSGYYSSHYVMRAYSHLFGLFLLGRDRQIVEMSLSNGRYSCEVHKKKNPLEHQFYWELPYSEFGVPGNFLFTKNPKITNDSDISDGFHRVYANYFDHVNQFPNFTPLDEIFLKDRVNKISDRVTDSPTIPDHSKFADLDSVHVIAYARIVEFRSFLDEILDPKNRYWGYFRKPSWFLKYIDFQILDRSTLASDKIAR